MFWRRRPEPEAEPKPQAENAHWYTVKISEGAGGFHWKLYSRKRHDGPTIPTDFHLIHSAQPSRTEREALQEAVATLIYRGGWERGKGLTEHRRIKIKELVAQAFGVVGRPAPRHAAGEPVALKHARTPRRCHDPLCPHSW